MGKDIQNTTQVVTNSFSKGLNKDTDPSFVESGLWTHARNMVNNTDEGNLGTLSNEDSNYLCGTSGETMQGEKDIIGLIHLFADKWIVFTVANVNGKEVNSEIGLYEEEFCRYRPIVSSPCLRFSRFNLITGATKQNGDCTWEVYWADGLNVDRYLNIGDPKTWPETDLIWGGSNQAVAGANYNYYLDGSGNKFLWPITAWQQICEDGTGTVQIAPDVWPQPNYVPSGCIICNNINELDCDKIRLASLVKTPCVELSIGPGTGTLENGTYFAVIAYTIKTQKVTNYFSPSNLQPVYTERDLSQGSLQVNLDLDTVNFDQFELVIVASINENVIAKKIGYYSTSQRVIVLDDIPLSLETVPLSYINIQNPVYETSDQMVNVGQYLLRIAPKSKFDFNYQPLANLINTKWVSVEYPEDYYIKGGSKTGYLRDEVYAFFIRWVYNTGDKSASYHIPGRAPQSYTFTSPNGSTQTLLDNAPYIGDINSFADDTMVFQTYNTATQTNLVVSNNILPDGGRILAKGKMGYWQSTEFYPNQPNVWNSTFHCWTGVQPPAIPGQTSPYDLCGKPIRHHKFPDNGLTNETFHFRVDNANFLSNPSDGKKYIRIMGVEFDNIIYPKDNDGNDIPGIVGYEILRGSREGNQTIIAKGMINNFRDYQIQGQSKGNRRGLYANYPFNCTLPLNNQLGNSAAHDYRYNDPFIKTTTIDSQGNETFVNQTIPRNLLTFTSPDTSFRNPFLNQTELKIYGSLEGNGLHQFIIPNKHPENQLMSNEAFYLAVIVGLGNAFLNLLGKQQISTPSVPDFQIPYQKYDNWTWTPAAGGNYPAIPSPSVAPYNLPGQPDLAGPTIAAANLCHTTYITKLQAYQSLGGQLGAAVVGGVANPTLEEIFQDAADCFQNAGLYTPQTLINENTTATVFNGIPGASVLTNLIQIPYYFTEGFNTTLRVIQAFLPFRQYALQSIAHGFYARFVKPNNTYLRRFAIEEGFYLTDSNQEVPDYLDGFNNFERFSINNLNRTKTAFLRTAAPNNVFNSPLTAPTEGPWLIGTYAGGVQQIGFQEDNSLINLGKAVATASFDMSFANETRFNSFLSNIASHYVGIKYNVQNQYGQLNSIKQVVATSCEQRFDPNLIVGVPINSTCLVANQNVQVFHKILPTTEIVFGGDTYINRFTEKNTMLFFYNWLYNLPDGTPWNYALYNNIPTARFWMNSQPYSKDENPLAGGVLSVITTIQNLITAQPNFGTGPMPKDYYNLDNSSYNLANDSEGNYDGFNSIKNAFFYLANSGVRDFFVESNVLVDFRAQGTFQYQQPYIPYQYTDMRELFDMDPEVITKGNFYNYDYSLSVTKFFTQYISAGSLQGINYDPNVAELCFTYYPNRSLYSLYQDDQSYENNWLIYLPLNYVQFRDKITTVKPTGMTGMIFTFPTAGPLFYQGIDQLTTNLGKKVTIGDGGLFSTPPQSSSNADAPFEYGSSQNIRSVIYSPAGLYYVSMNQGKIFAYGEGLKEISQNGLKWWFTLFLPYKLTESFPDFPHADNPVAGIGVQTTYDSRNSILYFSKKDYKLKPGLGKVRYDRETNRFIYANVKYQLGDPALFDDASWTISYDPKLNVFISFHDWHPDLSFSSKDTVFTTKRNTIWKHNDSCDDYTNYYGVQYPFEIEYPILTGQSPTVIKSFEYILEAYRYSKFNCVDQFHVLDANFNQAVVSNTEQVSGYLNLNIFPKNNITLSLEYPKLNQSNLSSFDILFSKEENKYRFNQFWDITKDRGEFPIGSDYPPTGPLVPGTTQLLGNYADQVIWNTQPNGYIKTLNQNNLNYAKPELQRKKFRHYLNYLFLSKLPTDQERDINFILKIINSKNQASLR
jgi:hypothetical protein